uniref:Myosin motor domain-containing protein n=1 Tax=Zooxanthella nutricula TaxID=1333877 RepID=A0A7S2NT35_9DINO
MTVRNNNSSRFGKWLQMTVAQGSAIKGCSVTDYLLELTRVCKQGEKERNYHVFFQLLQAKDEFGDDMVIMEPSKYKYIKDSAHVAPNVDDRQFFDELKAALSALGFSSAMQLEIFKVVMGVLTLGNTEFAEAGEGSTLKDDKPVKDTADMLGIPFEDLKRSLVCRLLKVGNDVTVAPRSRAQAEYARDGLARLMYGRLFKFLIARINKVLSEGGDLSGQYFGVLDIAGFECFEVNSIEQLSINLGNEHLQAHFNNHIFKMELDDYKAEGIAEAASLTYQDNSDIIALLDSKASILGTLDEEVSVPKATDETFHAKICKNFASHARFVAPKFSGHRQFGVRHFAGEVTYTADGFLEKNVDKPPDEAPVLFQASKWEVLKEIGAVIAQELKEAAAPGKKKMKTVSSGFRSSLAALMKSLSEAEPHFIRCIKPNQQKAPNLFQAPTVMDQLNCSGVFEAVRIRQSGFSTRVTFREFALRYRSIVPRSVGKAISQGLKGGAGDLAAVKRLVEALPEALSVVGCELDPADMAFGKTKVFARTKLVSLLDKARDMALAGDVVDIQRLWRGHCIRKTVRQMKVTLAEVERWFAENKFYKASGPENTAIHSLKTPEAIEEQVAKVDQLLEKTHRLPVRCACEQEVLKVRRRMLNEVDTLRSITPAMCSVEPLDLDKVITRCKDLDIVSPDVSRLKERFESLKVQVPLVKAMTNAMEGADIEEMQEVMELVKKQNLHTHPENWLRELQGEKVATEMYASMESLKMQRKQEELKKKQHEEAQAKLTQDVNAATRGQAFEVDKEAEAKKKAREEKKKRKSTITGLTIEDQSKILLELMGAMEVHDLGRLEAALNEALKQGVQEKEVMTDAQNMYQNLSMEDWLASKLDEQTKALDVSDNNTTLKSVQNLIKQAEKLQVALDQVQVAKRAVQAKMRVRARATIKGKIFEEVDVEEMGLLDNSFANLADYGGLKNPVHEWRGHKSTSLFKFGDSGPAHMLVHNKADLKDSLTKIPPALESQATCTFHNILGWMYDRPVPEVQRASLMKEVVAVATQDKSLADEIYVQTMKQLTRNPSTRSVAQGWKLMMNLCQHVCPGSSLHEFVHLFLLKNLKETKHNSEVLDSIRQCVADLNMTAAPEKVDQDTTPLEVMLIDGSMRKVLAPTGSNLQQLREIIAEQLKINKASDFAFFHYPDGVGHRLLPDNVALSTLLKKWTKLKEMTGKCSTLMFKRKFLRVDEYLQPGDLAHATLTYKQALWDYLHYPIQEDMRAIQEIAVRIAYVERDHFKQYIEHNKLGQKGVLEQLIPEVVLKDKHRSSVARTITEQYYKLKENLDPNEHRLVTMSRVFSLMQRLRLFGAYHWQGRQVMDVPTEKKAVLEAPKEMCLINAKAAEGNYWIAVDFFGVRFVPVDAEPGNMFQKGFLFNEEAVERVLIWGAKQNVVQFVVSTVNPAMPHLGRVPMTIAMSCPLAVDIHYVVDFICSMKGMAERQKRQALKG